MKTVIKKYRPYNKQVLHKLHMAMCKDFGRLNVNWGFKTPLFNPGEIIGDNELPIEYWFLNEYDVLIFGLKYQEYSG